VLRAELHGETTLTASGGLTASVADHQSLSCKNHLSTTSSSYKALEGMLQSHTMLVCNTIVAAHVGAGQLYSWHENVLSASCS
jgi:hypothetical protein